MTRLTILAAILAALAVACGDKHDDQDKDHTDHAGHDHDDPDHDDGEHDGHDKDEHAADDDDEHAGHDHGAGDSKASSKIDEAMKGLSDADQKLARAQGICPVSDEPLGEMGTPIKREVKGKTVFLCCAGCIKRLERDPDKYLAKLK